MPDSQQKIKKNDHGNSGSYNKGIIASEAYPNEAGDRTGKERANTFTGSIKTNGCGGVCIVRNIGDPCFDNPFRCCRIDPINKEQNENENGGWIQSKTGIHDCKHQQSC